MDGHPRDFRHWTESRLQADSPPPSTVFPKIQTRATSTLTTMGDDFLDVDWPGGLDLGAATVLTGADRGKYPHGNSLLVRGTRQVALIDPSLTIAERGLSFSVDHVLLSHVHEDHLPGLSQLEDVPVHCHEADAIGLASLDGLMTMYGMPAAVEENFRREVVDEFYYAPRTEVSTFTDAAIFDLGGVEIEVVHTPGHTKGHCVFVIPQARTAYLGDIDLSGFGPYYFDEWSSLYDFEQSIERCRSIDADHFVTFHHKWVISGRENFLALLDQFANVITNRELSMLEFLKEPRSLDQCAAHRFVYRPHVEMQFVNHVELSSAQIHLDRMVNDGRVIQLNDGNFRAA